MTRHILHLDMDTFYVSVERLENSFLIGKPVIVGGTSDRGVVASCSYEARQFGIHSAMPIKMARQLCPSAIFVKGNYAAYNRYSSMVTDILKEGAPVVEKASIDEHYLDLSGMDKHIGVLSLATQLRQRIIKETGLPISFGLSANKTVSKIATGQAKPNGQLYIPEGTERTFLAPLPVKKIPMVGEKTQIQLQKMGINTIGDLQQADPAVLLHVLGKNGIAAWRKANGICDSPVVAYGERKSLSKEETFEKDTSDLARLKKTIIKMVEGLGYDLRHEGKLASSITVKIRYSDFRTESIQARITHTASDKCLSDKAIDLFNKLYARPKLLRLVGVKFSGLVRGNYQIRLFDDTIARASLYSAMDNIKNRFGAGIISNAALV